MHNKVVYDCLDPITLIIGGIAEQTGNVVVLREVYRLSPFHGGETV